MILFITAISIIVILFLYLLWIRPRQLRWGATPAEVNISLPGDVLVSKPDFIATRAVSIKASPAEVWPWIIQIGSKRAGWYSIDWMDNAGIPSSSSIIPEYQVIEIGQFIPFTPNQKNGMWVKDFCLNEYILWDDKKGSATWLWFLSSEGGQQTRLLTRLRTKYKWMSPWILYYLIYDIGDIIMMRKCLLGIKQRVEAKK
ncbi:MAG: hypothetical protein GYA14_07940 [Ignavibacteria bacterium]|nr:hypothetical protein [Ignavibacteria bacterium]